MFQLLSTIVLKFGICLYNVKKYVQQYIKNIFNNFLITTPHRTRTLLFQKLRSLASAPAPESGNAPMLHRFHLIKFYLYVVTKYMCLYIQPTFTLIITVLFLNYFCNVSFQNFFILFPGFCFCLRACFASSATARGER